jgi:hypothetical protein
MFCFDNLVCWGVLARRCDLLVERWKSTSEKTKRKRVGRPIQVEIAQRVLAERVDRVAICRAEERIPAIRLLQPEAHRPAMRHRVRARIHGAVVPVNQTVR